MIVVVASRYDEAARCLVDRWPGHAARVLTCEDLSTPGWRWTPARDPSSLSRQTAVVAGESVDCPSIRGVITRRPSVLPQELAHIASADRVYVAAEITAFLTAWLDWLPCPVLNRPSAGCLSGPAWRAEQWLWTAARLGIAVPPCRRAFPATAAVAPEALTEEPVRGLVIGSRVIGDIDAERATALRQLAAAAGVDLLEGRFRGPQLIAASCWPDLRDSAIVPSLAGYFESRSPA